MTELLEKLLPQIGTVLDGKYRVEGVLGEGGFGVVYRAVQINLDRDVAIKMLLPHALADKMAVHRFKREVDLARRLEHPNTVHIFDHGQTETGLQYYSMEYVKGKTLSDVVVDEGPLMPDRVQRIAEQVLMSLGEAHEKGIVHRDLKPGNIMLTSVFGKDDHVKVLDFGIGKAVGVTDVTQGPATQGIIGTPFYMSPEQAMGVDDLDGRSDLYALGLIMHEIMTGRKVVDGNSPLIIVMTHARPDPLTLEPTVVAGPLGDIVIRSLMKNRDERYLSAAAMLKDVQNRQVAPGAAYTTWPSQTPHSTIPPHTPQQLNVGPSVPHQAETIADPRVSVDAVAAQKKPSSAKGIVLAVLVLAIAGLIVFLVGGPPSEDTPREGDAGEQEGNSVAASGPDASGVDDGLVGQADVVGSGTTTGPGLVDVALEPEQIAVVVDEADASGEMSSALFEEVAPPVGSDSADSGDGHRTAADLEQTEDADEGSFAGVDSGRPPIFSAEFESARLQAASFISGFFVQVEIAHPEIFGPGPIDGDTSTALEEPFVVTISGYPSGANVSIDGDRVCDDLPCEIPLEAGVEELEVRVWRSDWSSERLTLTRDPERTYEVELERDEDDDDGECRRDSDCTPGAVCSNGRCLYRP